ncbi:MAG: TetR/AcrR family transcriptional regulator, partial [Solobacterium sp.]|nr:TetR/AcrR family transcriptional regulator [Solobacterium sp.]
DIRAQVTKQLIRSALLARMKEKPVSRITVRELCTASGISRPTFYQYYRDVFDLAEQTEQDFIEALRRHIGAPLPSGKDERFARYRAMCALFLENRDLFLGFYGPNGDPAFIHKIIDSSWRPEAEEELSYPLNYTRTFLFRGTAAVMYDWLQKGDARESLDEITAVITHLTFEGITPDRLS